MSEVACIKRKIKDKECLAIKWRDILIGYVFEENPDEWRISNDLKGEFWSLEAYPTEQIATETRTQEIAR